jgi:hypothetical protein
MFSKVLFLTQAERPDRTKQCQDELKRVGLKAEPYYAISADNPFKSFCLSQKSMVDSITSDGALLLEDDVVFKNLNNLQNVINELPEDFDLLYLGANVTDPHPEYVSPLLRRIRSAWTTHAIVYSLKAAKYISENYVDWETSGMYDDWLSREFLPKKKCYICCPMIAIQRPVYSDMWQRQCSYGWDSIDKKLMSVKPLQVA